MAAKCLILLACLALSHAALVKRDAPTALQEMEKHAAEFQKTFSDEFQKLVNSQDSQKFNKALKDGSETVLSQISVLSTALQSALSDSTGKAKEALEKTKANLETTAAELRKAHPEVEQQATALKEKLQAAVTNAVQETQNLAKQVSASVEQTNQKLSPKIQAAYNDFVKQAEEVQKKLHEAANAKQ